MKRNKELSLIFWTWSQSVFQTLQDVLLSPPLTITAAVLSRCSDLADETVQLSHLV